MRLEFKLIVSLERGARFVPDVVGPLFPTTTTQNPQEVLLFLYASFCFVVREINNVISVAFTTVYLRGRKPPPPSTAIVIIVFAAVSISIWMGVGGILIDSTIGRRWGTRKEKQKKSRRD